eukprot:3671551-Pleurochrysis_carterae.AAC.1
MILSLPLTVMPLLVSATMSVVLSPMLPMPSMAPPAPIVLVPIAVGMAAKPQPPAAAVVEAMEGAPSAAMAAAMA